MSADQVHFQEVNSKKSANFATHAPHARQSINLQKKEGTLNINIFFENLQNPSLYMKEQPTRKNYKLKAVKYFFFQLPKMVKTVFDLYMEKLICWGGFLQFLLLIKQAKSKYCFSCNL